MGNYQDRVHFRIVKLLFSFHLTEGPSRKPSRRMIHAIFAFLLSFTLAISLVEAQSITFTSGIDPAVGHGLIAKGLDLFKKHSVKVVVKKFPSATAGLRTVAAGENEAGQASSMSLVSNLAQGGPLRVIGSTRKKLKKFAAVVATADIKQPSDLNGKKIGLKRGSSSSNLFFMLYAKHHGLKDYKVTWLPPQQMLIAFSKGEIDAYAIWSPWWQKGLEVRKGAHVLAYDQDNGVYSGDVVIIIHKKIQRDRTTVEALTRALVEADEYMQNNPNGAAKILAKEMRTTPEKVLAIMTRLEQHYALDDILMKDLCQSYGFLARQKKVKREPDWAVGIDPSFLKAVAPRRVTYKSLPKCKPMN